MPYRSRWSIPIPDCSLPTFLFTSATHRDNDENKPCYISVYKPETNRLTRGAFRDWSQRFAFGLQRKLGVQTDDRIMVVSPNSLAFPVLFMGTIMAGGIFTPANPAFTAREIAYQLANSGAKYLFVVSEALDRALEAARMNGFDKENIRWFDEDVLFNESIQNSKKPIRGVQYWGSTLGDAEEAKEFQWNELKGAGEAKEKILTLNYSSGTTGIPKGVMITHRNYVSNTIQHMHIQFLRSDAKAIIERAKWLCYVPMYHAMGQTIYLSGSLYLRAPVYVMSKFDLHTTLSAIERFRITDFKMVPPIAVLVSKHPDVKRYDLSSVEYISSGAAPLGSEASRAVEKVWNGRLNIKQGWGMTEVTTSLLGWDPKKYSASFGVGEPNPNCEAMIVKVKEDDKGNQTFEEILERGPEHSGELWCRGPNVMKGYWRNPEATKNTFSPDGQWLRTGDIAYVDDEGCFFIVDRLKELIKVKGNQVAPAELEALILDHPAVADVAVIGIPTPEGDEQPKAFCVRQPGKLGSEVQEADIIDFVKDKVIYYKRLSGGCEFVDVIPKNPSGKILRRQLRDRAKTETRARL